MVATSPCIGRMSKGEVPFSSAVGWIVQEGQVKGVRMASWVLKEEKEPLHPSLVVYLKSDKDGLNKTVLWLDRKMPVSVRLIHKMVIWSSC